MSSYTGKAIAVTGAASGIGAAVARAIANEGAIVIGVDRVTAEIADVRWIATDLGDPNSIEHAADEIGTVDALFNCAGLPPTRPPLDVIKVNLLGTRLLTERLAAKMPAGAAIASTSSNGGLAWRERLPLLRDMLATPDFAGGLAWIESHLDEIGHAYRFTKEALTVWTMERSAHLIARGIRINCTSPGAVETPMLAEIERSVPAGAIDIVARPIGRRSTPDEQASALLFLNSDAAAYINGVDLPVDGGFAAALALR